MRCATCGTENAPDSRFCGGCGARQPSSAEARVAPTHKIQDDAAYPQQPPASVARPQGPVSYAPPSIPPSAPPVSVAPAAVAPAISTPPPGSLVRPGSQPSPYQAPQPHVSARPPQVSSASGSFVVPPRRPIGLIVVLLIVDLGLAAAGGLMLSKGLAAKDDKKSAPPPAEKKSSLDTSVPPSVPPTAPATTAPAAETARAPEPAPAPEPRAQAAEPRAKAAARDPRKRDKPAPVVAPDDTSAPQPATPQPATPVATVPSQPQDPYAAPNTEQEIDAAAAQSRGALDRCAAGQDVHGSIKIAFQVRHDGRVINAAAVENTTGNDEVARCLASEISTWKVSAHNSTSINLLRPFTYP